MKHRPGDDEPDSPYPGLRPFRDDESAVFFGRESQIDEVLARLGQQRFVVVLGGSGSGKSSLIKAGVIPGLRSWRLRDAGDVWLTVVATPGTNQATADVPEAQRQTPIDRLAAKLAMALGATEQARRAVPDAQRVREIADTLRERDGWHKVYDQIVPLNEFDGVSTPAALDALRQRTNLLVVLDQFEELFHPSNAGVRDCLRLVERVLEHDTDPHARIYLILTMRSEYLNRCAAHLRLPDAINKASYLVRRLSPFEIKQCITLPAQHYLSMLANRDDAGAAPLPRNIAFDAEVLERIRADVDILTHNPDHLPLLQHLLARLWDAALARARAAGQRLPERISAPDLVHAVTADADPSRRLPDGGNVLGLSVQNWADRTWRGLGAGRQQQMRGLLPRLAFKDPNTGEEVQRRLRAGEGCVLLGGGATVDTLKELVRPFLSPLEYLHWDDENPEAITLKVSHEAFIRGWPLFRDIVAEQADGFDDFLEALRRCEDWCEQQRSDQCLLSRDQLRALRSHGFDALRPAADQALGRDWLRLLDIKHDGSRWADRVGDLPALAAASEQYIGHQKTRRRATYVGVAATLLVLLSVAAMWIDERVTGSTLNTQYRALNAAHAEGVTLSNLDLDSEQTSLCALQRASYIAGRLGGAAEGQSRVAAGFAWLETHVPLFAKSQQRRQMARLLSEQGVGSMLENTLERTPLLTAAAPVPLQKLPPDSCGNTDARRCWCLKTPDGRAIQVLEQAAPSAQRGSAWRLELRSAHGNSCEGAELFYNLPPNTLLYIDANLRFLVFAAPVPSVSRLDWLSAGGGSNKAPVLVTRLLRSAALQPVLAGFEQAESPQVSHFASRREAGRLHLQLGDRQLSFVDLELRAAADSGAAPAWRTLRSSASSCRAGDEVLHSLVFELRGRSGTQYLCGSTTTRIARDAGAPGESGAAKHGPVGLMATFRLPRDVEPDSWQIGTGGERQGWLAGITGDGRRYEAPVTLAARHAALSRLLDGSGLEERRKACRLPDFDEQ